MYKINKNSKVFRAAVAVLTDYKEKIDAQMKLVSSGAEVMEFEEITETNEMRDALGTVLHYLESYAVDETDDDAQLTTEEADWAGKKENYKNIPQGKVRRD
jgi:L-fucose isomerase-like protein